MAEEQTWRTIASRTSRKINFGWWLQVLATPLLITALVIACGILIVRREMDSLPWLEIGGGTLAALILTGIACWLAARTHFESSQQSLVRIEAAMRLRNALTAADHGIAPWPEVPAMINDGTSWHWKRLAPPLIGAVLIIACGFLIPIHAKSTVNTAQEPTAWNELDTSLDQLNEQEVVQQDYIDEMRDKLEKLREQSPDEWFSHSSLEATDNLKKNHANEQESLKNNLQRAEKNLAELQKGGGKMNEEKKQRLLNEFDQALKKMEQGGIKPNEKLLKQLQKLDPKELDKLTPEQMNQLRENMRKHAEKLNQQGGKKGDQPGEGEDDWMKDPEGDGEDGEDGEKPGKGGINRGPGTAPDVLGDPHADAGKGKLERLKNDNKEQALPGDLLQTSDGEHDVDETKKGPTAGGAASNKGKGGDRVWKDSLLPEEQKALKKFFK